MKKFNRYLIVSSIIALVLFIGGCITLITVDLPKLPNLLAEAPNFSFTLPQENESNIFFKPSSDNQYSHYYEETFSFDRPNIEFDLVSANLSIIKTDSPDVKLIIRTSTPENYYLESGATLLSLEENRPFCIGFCVNDSKTEVILEVPSTVTLNTLDIETINTVTHLSNLTIDHLELEGVNGPITLDNLETSFSTIEHINGDIMLDNVSFNNMAIDSVNSPIAISNIDGDYIDCSVVNGSLDFKNVYASNINIDKLSGQLTFINTDKTYEIQYLTTSKLKPSDLIDANIKHINE